MTLEARITDPLQTSAGRFSLCPDGMHQGSEIHEPGADGVASPMAGRGRDGSMAAPDLPETVRTHTGPVGNPSQRSAEQAGPVPGPGDGSRRPGAPTPKKRDLTEDSQYKHIT